MKTTYEPGKWLAICDVCGFRTHQDKLRKRWDMLMVCENDWEIRHPQDFLRVRGDNPAVPWARPEPPDLFIPVVYICTQDGRTAIPSRAVAGCSISGSSSGIPIPPNPTAVAGRAISGIAISGYP